MLEREVSERIDDPAADQNDQGLRQTLRRQRFLLGIAVVAAVLAAAGMVASVWIKSPAQLATEAAPPAPSVLTAPVQQRVLASTIVVRGSVYAAQEYRVTPPVPDGSQQAVITSEPIAAGSPIAAGAVVVEVSGRPLIALPGRFPAYRDLHSGETGPDVAQIQQALHGLGFSTGRDADGTLGSATESAIEKLYDKLGYALPETGGAAMIPAAELLFLPELPATLTALSGQVGDVAAPPLVTARTGSLAVTGRLDLSQQQLVRTGMKASILSESTGQTATGTIAVIGPPTSAPTAGHVITIGADGGLSQDTSGPEFARYLPLQIATDSPLPESLAGRDVRIEIETASTRSPVLVVPASAITTTTGNATQVTVIDSDGIATDVKVNVGASAAGYVQVTPTNRQLTADMLVAIGSI